MKAKSSGIKTRETIISQNMRIDCITKVFFLVFAMASAAYADDLEDARRAYGAGEFTEASTLLRPLAREGNVEAQYLLGRLYEQGDGVAKDTAEAKRLYNQAAAKGHKLAGERLAIFGSAQSGEESVALGWYLPAAKQGDTDAQYNLGYMYETGWGVSTNEKEAVRWYHEAANSGHDQAQLRLGMMYIVGAGVTASKATGIDWLRKSAASGSRIAQRIVQELFDAADGDSLDATKIIGGLRRVIDEGDKRALGTLTASLEAARGRHAGASADSASRVADSGGRAAKSEAPVPSRPPVRAPVQSLSFSESSTQAVEEAPVLSPAQSNLRATPEPASSDENTRFRTAQMGATQGKADAQFDLAVAYVAGRGVRLDQQEALNWFKQAAAKGHDGALTYMQLWDDQLESSSAGGTVAVSWLKEGARRWELDALFRLGYLFETGNGVTPSIIEATKWYRLAAGEGHSEARRRLGAIERGGRAAPETPPPLTVSSATASAGMGGKIAIGVVVLLVVGIGFYVRRHGLPKLSVPASINIPTAGAMNNAKQSGPASEDLAFLKDLWADGAAAHAKAVTVPAAKPMPPPAEARRPAEEERPAREPKPAKVENAEAVAAPVSRGAETPAAPLAPAQVATPAPVVAQAPTPVTASRESSGKVTAAELKSGNDQSRRGEAPQRADMDGASRFDNVRHILAEDFVRVGISRDELAAGRVSADSLFGGAVPLDRAGKVLRRVNGDPQRLSADSLMSEFGSNFAAEGMPAPRKPVAKGSIAAPNVNSIASQNPKVEAAKPAAAVQIPVPAKPAITRPAIVKPVAVEARVPPLDMHAPLTADEERSLAEVHFNIGLMFARGEGVPKNDQLAAKWYQKAAEEGLAEAQFSLSEFYTDGTGVKADASKAAYWLEKATQGGFVPARERMPQRNQAG